MSVPIDREPSDDELARQIELSRAHLATARARYNEADADLRAARLQRDALLEKQAARALAAGADLAVLLDVAVAGSVPYGDSYRRAADALHRWLREHAPSGVTRDWAHMSDGTRPLMHTPVLMAPHGSVVDPAVSAAEFQSVVAAWDEVLGYPDEVLFSVRENTLSENGSYGVRWQKSSDVARVVFTRYHREQELFSGTLAEVVVYLTQNAWYGDPEVTDRDGSYDFAYDY